MEPDSLTAFKCADEYFELRKHSSLWGRCLKMRLLWMDTHRSAWCGGLNGLFPCYTIDCLGNQSLHLLQY